MKICWAAIAVGLLLVVVVSAQDTSNELQQRMRAFEKALSTISKEQREKSGRAMARDIVLSSSREKLESLGGEESVMRKGERADQIELELIRLSGELKELSWFFMNNNDELKRFWDSMPKHVRDVFTPAANKPQPTVAK